MYSLLLLPFSEAIFSLSERPWNPKVTAAVTTWAYAWGQKDLRRQVKSFRRELLSAVGWPARQQAGAPEDPRSLPAQYTQQHKKG